MAMQARRVQIIVACNLAARLTRSKRSVNFSSLDVLACAAFSRHATHLTHYRSNFFRPRGGPGLIPKHPVMRRSSRNDIGTAIAPLNQARAAAMLTHRRHRPRLKAAIPLSDLVFFQAEFGRPQ